MILETAARIPPNGPPRNFQFCLYPGSISSNKKGEMASVIMVEVERDNPYQGL
jgi:hypothetical protein